VEKRFDRLQLKKAKIPLAVENRKYLPGRFALLFQWNDANTQKERKKDKTQRKKE